VLWLCVGVCTRPLSTEADVNRADIPVVLHLCVSSLVVLSECLLTISPHARQLVVVSSSLALRCLFL